jgi:DNA primase
MAIDFGRFKHWVQDRFPDAIVKGKEIRINSIFESDHNYHLWCSPSGGKKKRANGVFHCFKTDNKGSLVKLVMLVDKIPYDEASAILKGEANLGELERQVEELMEAADRPFIENKPKVRISLPDECYAIDGLRGWWGDKAREYLAERKIPHDGLYICTGGKYKARIILPYYDRDGDLCYFNGRHIGKSKLKYLGPEKEIGVGKEDVVFMPGGVWPALGSTVHLCEGEFNSKSLSLCGFNGAAAGGKNLSEKQAVLLKDYKLVICLDRDKAGEKGSMAMAQKIMSISLRFGKDKLRLVQPPEGYNDWNDMLKKFGTKILYEYVLRAETTLDSESPFGAAAYSARLK